MRIDYSPPRTSATGASLAGKQRSPGNSSLRSAAVIAVLGGMVFTVGFGTGWYFSQQATKRAFRAAMEQNSLESTPLQAPAAPAPVPPPPPAAATPAAIPPLTTPPVPVAGTVPAAPQKPAATPPPAGAPLSFYENLPSGQKNTVLGSGINEKPKPLPTPAQPVAPAAAPPKPADAPPASPSPAAAPTSGAAGWVVQVAAFSSQKEAEALKAKLAAKGYTASVMETNLSDKGTWYRVRIGRHMSKEAAMDIASRIGGGAKALPDQD